MENEVVQPDEKYWLERKCMQNALKRVSMLLSLTNNDEIDNVMKLTSCMNSIVCQIRNLDEENVGLYAPSVPIGDADDDFDFTVD